MREIKDHSKKPDLEGRRASAGEEEKTRKVGRKRCRESGVRFSICLFTIQVETEWSGGRRNLNSRDIETKWVEITHTHTHTHTRKVRLGGGKHCRSSLLICFGRSH